MEESDKDTLDSKDVLFGNELETEGESLWETFRRKFKFCLILFSYAAAFYSMITFGYWLVDTSVTASPEFQKTFSETTVFRWMVESIQSEDWLNDNIRKVGIDFCLLSIFALQHTLLSSRILRETSLWHSLHHEYQLDKPIYVLTTALTLQFLTRWWQYIPVKVWNLDFLLHSPAFHFIHIVSWASVYGTTLMLDLPEMVGLNQVVVQSPTLTVKSPQFQMMVRKQRHMGLVPFIAIFITYPYMTLDRFLVLTFLTWYLCRQWTSDFAYDYARDMRGVKKLRLSL